MADIDYSLVPIEALKLSTRSHNCLKRNHVNFVSELLALSREELAQFKNMGEKSIEEIEDIRSRLAETELNEIHEDQAATPEISVLDTQIKAIGLSKRSTNCLTDNGIGYVRELIWLNEDDVAQMRNAGAKSITEISEFLKGVDKTAISEVENYCADGKIPTFVAAAISETVACFEISFARAYDAWRNVYNSSPEASIEEITRLAYENKVLKSLLRNKILDFSTNWSDELDPRAVRESLPSHITSCDVFEIALSECEREGFISVVDGIYTINYPSISDYIVQMDDKRASEVLRSRLNGRTLNEIGDELEISRERVRQICAKALLNHPKLREDKYIDLFGMYSFTIDEFTHIFNESAQTYYYLDMVSTIVSADKAPLKQMLGDLSVSAAIRKRAEGIVYKDYVLDSGVYIPRERAALFEYYFTSTCLEKTGFDAICDGYNDFLAKHNLQDDDSLKISPRTYENKLGGCSYALSDLFRSYRYYKIEDPEKDYKMLIGELDIPKYTGKVISTLKLFRHHSELMELFDIRNEYELHNLLRKIWQDFGSCEVEFSKMPTIKIGTCDERTQMYEFMAERAPISAPDLCSEYEEAYGIKSALALAMFVKELNIYYHHGVFSVDFEEFTPEQLEYMRGALTEPFYSLNDVKAILRAKFPSANLSLISSHNVKLLGYGMYSSYILKRELTAAEYIEDLMRGKDEFDTDTLPRDLTQLVIFSTVVYEQRAKRKIVEHSPHKYFSIEKLNSMGIDKRDLEEYCDDVAAFVPEGEFFTVNSLRRAGFEHSLSSHSLDDWFYSSVIIEDTARFSYKRMGGTRLMYRGNQDITVAMFLKWLLNDIDSISLHELSSLLVSKYDLWFSTKTLIENVRGAGFSYDSIMETVYRAF